MTVEVWLDGELRKSVEITSANLFTFDNKFVLEGEALANGEHTLELRRTGQGRSTSIPMSRTSRSRIEFWPPAWK
ncbi:MAG: hypothetical protein R3B96_17340 [Pirellulaceae bacterium]